METSESENFGSWIEMSEIKVMAVGYKAAKKKKKIFAVGWRCAKATNSAVGWRGSKVKVLAQEQSCAK